MVASLLPASSRNKPILFVAILFGNRLEAYATLSQVKNLWNAAGRFVVKLARLVFVLLVALLVASGILYLGFEFLLRAAYESLPSRPDPASDYAAAVNRFRYPGFSSRALGQLLRLSVATFAGAVDRAPKVQDVVMVTSKSDEAVSDSVAWLLIGLWRSKGLFKFAAVDFPKSMQIEHDMIDPANHNQRTDIVYPVLVSLLNAP
jgi:hypothetical protein